MVAAHPAGAGQPNRVSFLFFFLVCPRSHLKIWCLLAVERKDVRTRTVSRTWRKLVIILLGSKAESLVRTEL